MMPANKDWRQDVLTMLRRLLIVALLLASGMTLTATRVEAASTTLPGDIVQPVQYYYGGGYYGRRPYYRPYYRPRYYGPRFYAPRPFYRPYYHRRYYRPY